MDSKPGTRIDNSLHDCVLFSNYGDLWHAIFVANIFSTFINVISFFLQKTLRFFIFFCENFLMFGDIKDKITILFY